MFYLKIEEKEFECSSKNADYIAFKLHSRRKIDMKTKEGYIVVVDRNVTIYDTDRIPHFFSIEKLKILSKEKIDIKGSCLDCAHLNKKIKGNCLPGSSFCQQESWYIRHPCYYIVGVTQKGTKKEIQIKVSTEKMFSTYIKYYKENCCSLQISNELRIKIYNYSEYVSIDYVWVCNGNTHKNETYKEVLFLDENKNLLNLAEDIAKM